eukprot:Pgem_evm1s15904
MSSVQEYTFNEVTTINTKLAETAASESADGINADIASNVGTYLAKRLYQCGIREVFGVPGDYNLVLLDQFLKLENFKFIGCCNELNAGYAADGYARERGVAACVSTFTVGSLSLINAIAGAYSDSLPVICISGGINSNDFASDRILHHTMGLVDRDQPIRCFKEVTCHAVQIRSPHLAAQLIDEAISIAMQKQKPVYIEIACNIVELPLPESIPFHFPSQRPSNEVALSRAVDSMMTYYANAVKPVIIVGVFTRMTNAFREIEALAEAIGCAVAVMPDAKGMYNETRPEFIGTYWGAVSHEDVCEIVESSDVHIMIGARFNDYNTMGYTAFINPKGKLEIGVNRVKTAKGDFSCCYLKEVVAALTARILMSNVRKEKSLELFQRLKKSDSIGNLNESGSTEGNIVPRPAVNVSERLTSSTINNVIQDMVNIMPKSALIAETGDSWFNGQYIKLGSDTKYEFQMQYGSIGWSVGAVLGYSVSCKSNVQDRMEGTVRRPIAMIGDGSFQMTAQEVSTMIRFRVNPIVFLINNYGYGIETMIHDNDYNYIQNWNYTEFVQSLAHNEFYNKQEDPNVLTFKCITNQDLFTNINKAMLPENQDKMIFIECCIAQDDCSKQLLAWGTRVAHANSRAYQEL